MGAWFRRMAYSFTMHILASIELGFGIQYLRISYIQVVEIVALEVSALQLVELLS